MAFGNRTVFGVGVLSLVLSGCSCNTPPPTTGHLLGEGERCDEDDQCETALCVALPREDKTCRRSCESGCHSEEICTTFGTSANGGLRAGCVPAVSGLCLPCEKDLDCPYAADVCLNVGGATFCGRDCSYDEACPVGYTCTEGIAAEGGQAPKQCIPKSATCSCIPQTKGMKRPCELKNSFGTCVGNETCSGEAYVNCDARVPAAESCNNADDDCDGQTDEGMEDLTCGLGECAVTVKACVEGVAQTCTPKTGDAELCNGKDDDCDGKTDEDFDLTTVDRCGACDVQCTVAHGTAGCKEGACYVAGCETGFDDCDLKYETGCEANLNTDKDNCSVCLKVCKLPYAEAKCVAGACEVDACVEGHYDVDETKPGCEYSCTPTAGGVEKCDSIDNDCNGLTDDGLDLTTDPKNCLVCGNICPSLNGVAGCSVGGCTIQCNNGFADCDPLIPGCETNTNVSSDNCGGCGKLCQPANATGQCTGGVCEITQCAADFVDCDERASTGCETNIKTDPKRCGSCTKGCAVANGEPGCVDGKCTVKSCDSPWLSCGTYEEGCMVNGNLDDNNCGKCGNVCTSAVNSTVDCVGGNCQYTCTGDFQDCDTFAGCESNKKTDANHCGDCATKCPVPANTDPLCNNATCGWTCKSGWANCDASAGCEVQLDNWVTPSPVAPNCSQSGTATNLGTASGDNDYTQFTGSGRGEKMFKFRLTEDNDLPLALVTTITLKSPPNAKYGLIVSYPGCAAVSNMQVWDPGAQGGTIAVDTSYGDYWGSDDDHDVFVEVVWMAGTGCGNWELTVDAGF